MELIDKGKWVIPNFQRDFTWTAKQVKELTESVLESYYIGAILVWKCRGKKDAKLAIEPVYGSKIRKERRSRGFSQSELSKKLEDNT